MLSLPPSSSASSDVHIALPKNAQYLSAVRDSCSQLSALSTPDIQIDQEAINTFVEAIDPQTWTAAKTASPVRMPLKFDTLEQELNLMALIAFLSFGSGYREELRTELDRDHADTVRFGIMSMHISSVEINATFLSALTLAEVSAFFDIPITKEVAHATLPMTMTEPHPLRQLVQMLTDVLNEIGKALKVKGFRNLGHFLLDATNSGPTTGPTVERLLDAVLNTFPSARDMDRWGGIDTYIFRRAQMMVASLHQQFRDADPQRFNFVDVDGLTAFSDEVLIVVLLHLNILKVSPTVDRWLSAGKDLTKVAGKWDLRLRAAALEAVENIVASGRRVGSFSDMTPVEVDTYLRSLSLPDQSPLTSLRSRSSSFY